MGAFVDRYLGLFVTVAILAVILSRKSATVNVIQAASTAVSNILGSIVAPISNQTAATTASPQSPAATGSTPANSAGTVIAPAAQIFGV